MKSVRYLLLSILLVALICATGTPVYAAPGGDPEFADVPYYGRQALSELDNSDALLYAYDQIVAGVEICAEKFDVVKDGYVLSQDEFSTVFDAYIRDHTEHFWLGNAYSILTNSSSGAVVAVGPTYTMTGDELDAAKDAFEQAAEKMLSGITASMSEFDRELVLHNRLATAVSYAGGDHAHNAYGALVEGTAVCEGYAEALQYLLRRVGIQSFLIQGYGLNPSGQVEAHEWNAVRIDGNYYHVDLTWNDQGKYLFHSYFNLSTEAMEADHYIYDAAYDLPECDSNDASYFEVMDGKLDTFDVETVAAHLKKNDFVASFYLPADKTLSTFASWINEHAYELMDKLGIREGISVGYTTVGQEVILIMRPKSITHYFNVWYMISAPTCIERGEETRACAYCNYSETRDIEPYGHNYTDVVTAPTCTEQGYTTHTCANCGDSYVDSYVDATGHSFGEWAETNAPTCTEDGEDRRDCGSCDHYETREVAAKGHSHTAVVTAPTCTEQGYTTHTCANCGDSYVDSYKNASGHSIENTVENSTVYYTCTNCDHRKEADRLQAKEGRVSITLNDCPEQTEIFVAVFAPDGRMKGLQRVTVTDNHAQFTLGDCGRTDLARAFFLGAQHAPWLRSMDITLP